MLFFPKPWSDYDILKKLKVVIKTVKILKSRRLVDFFQSIDLSACTMDIYNKLIEAIEHDLSIKGIADIIKQDVALATKIMQLGNSIFYGPSECTSLEQAIVKLGLNTVKNISLLYSVSACANLNKVQQHWLNELTKDAAITALCMEKMCALSINKLDIDTASTIGVLKNIGRNILIAYKPEYYKQLLTIIESNPDIDAFEAESLSESTLPTHAEISGYYLMMLNLPFVIVESILYHHTPEKASESSQVYAKMLYIADKIIEPNMRRYNVFSLKLPAWVQEIISLEELEKLKNEVEKYYGL
jgi:HD-like signal output (HDOD) protein